MSLYRLCHFRSGLSATVIKEYCIVLYFLCVSGHSYSGTLAEAGGYPAVTCRIKNVAVAQMF